MRLMEKEQQLELSDKERQQVEIEIRKIVEQLGLDTSRWSTTAMDTIQPQEPAESTDLPGMDGLNT